MLPDEHDAQGGERNDETEDSPNDENRRLDDSFLWCGQGLFVQDQHLEKCYKARYLCSHGKLQVSLPYQMSHLFNTHGTQSLHHFSSC